jgi:hypothetical protein
VSPRVPGRQNFVTAKLDPELLDFSDRRAMQKRRYGGELFPANAIAAPPNTRYLEFFQIDRRSGDAICTLAIDLRRSR